MKLQRALLCAVAGLVVVLRVHQLTVIAHAKPCGTKTLVAQSAADAADLYFEAHHDEEKMMENVSAPHANQMAEYYRMQERADARRAEREIEEFAASSAELMELTGTTAAKAQIALQTLHANQQVPGASPEFDAAMAPSACKVLVADMDGWERYMIREYYHWMHGLLAAHDWKLVKPQWLLYHSQDEFAAQAKEMCGGTLPGFVLVAELFQVKLPTLAWLRRQGVGLGIWKNDANNFEERDLGATARQRFYNSFDVLFGPYTYLARVFYPSLRYPERVWQPNGVALEMQGVPLANAPLARVFVPGASERIHYPFRAWARDRAEGGDHRFVFLKHPGYGGSDGSPKKGVEALVATLKPDEFEISATVTGRDYARLMSKFLVCLTDLMRHTNLVAKHFEIPASGCLLLTSNQHPALLRAVGLVHMQNCLLYDKSDPIPMIDWALDPRNRAKVDEMRAAGRALVLSQHAIQNRSSLVDAHVSGMLSKQTSTAWWTLPDMQRDTACPCPMAREDTCNCAKQWQDVVHVTHPKGEMMPCAAKRMLRTFCVRKLRGGS